MKTSIVNISPPISCLAKFCFLNNWPNCCLPIKLQNSLKYNISRKKWMIKLIFDMQINIKVFYKFILSFWVFATRHVQSTDNNKFAYYGNMQKTEKNMGHEVDFLLLDKDESFCKLKQVFYKFSVLWVCIASHG